MASSEVPASRSVAFPLLSAALLLFLTGFSSCRSTGPPMMLDLRVSNQSFAIDPVDINIAIDGKDVVHDTFSVGRQHSWKHYAISLKKGPHNIIINTADNDVTFERSFEFDSPRWASIAFWYYPDSTATPMPPGFTFELQDSPFVSK